MFKAKKKKRVVAIKHWYKEKFVLYREILTWKRVNEEEIFPAKGDDRKAGIGGDT